MNKRLLVLIFTGLFLLLAVPLVEAGCGCSNLDEIDEISSYFDCESLTISWSHSTGIGSAILVVDYSTLTIVKQRTFSSASGSINLDFSPALPQSTVLSVLIIVVDNTDSYLATFDIDCIPDGVVGCADGRLNQTLCEPLAVYPVESEDGLGISIYKVSRGSDAGEFALYIPAEVFDSLPDEVAANCTIASSPDGEVVVYLLSSGQYQINIGPDEEGKVFAYIFDSWHSAPVQTDTYFSSATPEILPSCI